MERDLYATSVVVPRVENGSSPYALWAPARIPDPAQRNPEQDPDNDAFDNRQEHIADTDPTHAASFLRVTEIEILNARRFLRDTVPDLVQSRVLELTEAM